MAFDKSKFISRFVDEAREHAKKINEGLLHLEKEPDDSASLDAVFRAAHTIKGSSKMLQLKGIPDVAHTLEDALDALRKNNIKHSKGLSDLLFKGIDIISELIEQTASGQEITVEFEGICEELGNASQGKFSEKETTKTKTSELAEDKIIPEDKKGEDLPEKKEPRQKRKPDKTVSRQKPPPGLKISKKRLRKSPVRKLMKLYGSALQNWTKPLNLWRKWYPITAGLNIS